MKYSDIFINLLDINTNTVRITQRIYIYNTGLYNLIERLIRNWVNYIIILENGYTEL
jgi:hypothetical protein